MGFELSFTAADADIDEHGHVNNAVWVRWIQDLATRHWYAVADPAYVEASIWFVIRHEIDYLRPLRLGRTAIGRTWVPDPPRGARFDRLAAFDGQDGQPLVRARTTWAMLDRATGRPMRVPAALAARFHDPQP